MVSEQRLGGCWAVLTQLGHLVVFPEEQAGQRCLYKSMTNHLAE